MIQARAPLIGWGAFLAAGIAAAMLALGWQFAFAGLAIGLLGLPHGASDLAVVAPARRPGFLASYVGCIAAVMLVWRAEPATALALLLALSALHFAIDGDARHGAVRNVALGLFLVAGPALFHHDAIAALFDGATGDAHAATLLAGTLCVLAPVATAILVAHLISDRGDPPERWIEGMAIALTLALPPLVGFAIGFVLLHARGQTTERQHAIGCPTLRAYLVRVAPLMAGAFAVLALVAIETLRGGFGHATFLFAGIAALAVPHMLVTPLWRRAPSPAGRSRIWPAMTGNGR
ncbi:Brp/Blh family beta-carotene 15,15'-dioxygenase [Sphingomonas sp. CROZ-RG-20F-R02-07]|uniref:Brp/Blh family beta-carotene 15,15'-dioxygenase n=1 Tax=Sphingomonas sp. CROZ-RG-20F-R02-07 TaxID=2914832 RepID=UPI001F5A133A